MWRGIGATVSCGVLVVAAVACGTDESVPGQSAVNERTTVYNDPCAMPDRALVTAGLVGASKQPGTPGVEFNGWKGCTWKATADWYTFALYTGPRKLADFPKDPAFQKSFVPASATTLEGRDAVVFASVLDPNRREMCHIGVATSTGMALFRASTFVPEGQQPKGDICAETTRVGAELIKELPDADAAAPPTTPTISVTSESDVLAIFGNLDPCTVVTPAEVEQLTGMPDLSPNRTVSLEGRSAGCAWGGERPGLQIDFHGLVKDDFTIVPPNDRSRQVSAKLGRNADVTGYDATDCMVMTLYENPRRMVSIVVDPPGDEKVAGGVCQRALPIVETVLADRIPWP
ncbi:DUF3558 family protein [Nocardia transvalensis]|uniref:DUF3558 family protein n=1 Tax=Nocardia transvalensis TaxID=37333 RepID=UPI0018934FCB|nr:DUF3558 family protein [Nocardia transvalensis]MBF6333263.1 DUF3558 family protein [Nocardia transvalensis]